MGGTSWSASSYLSSSASFADQPRDKVFPHTKTKTLSNEMDAKGLKFRECRDSVAHPETLAVEIGLDVTGSMGEIPEKLVKDKLAKVMESLLNAGVNDAQVLFMGIGDSTCDHFPVQVGQFESGDTELMKWLTSVNIEGGGGGHGKESYIWAWLVAARHTSIDCFEKRGIKGVLMTIGDEAPWEVLTAREQKEFIGYGQAEDLTAEQLLEEVTKMYHVFHIHVNHDSGFMGSYHQRTVDAWKKLLGERVIICEDYNTVAEIISTTVAMIHGIDMEEFTKHFDKDTASSVKNALMKVDTSVAKNKKTEEGIVAL